jgi:histidyl-tRNA synthetase
VKAELTERGYPEAVGERCEWVVGLLSSSEAGPEVLDRAADLLPDLPEAVLDDLRATFEALSGIEENSGASVISSRLDPTIVRGMGYYTGQIFELAHPDSAGSIAGGGRYDGLVGRSLGREVPACGISIGFDRVVEMARFDAPDLGVAVLYTDQSVLDVLAAARALRASGRPAALVDRKGQMKVQLDALKAEGYSSFVVLEGDLVSEERPLRD